jgi:hypothetical protein
MTQPGSATLAASTLPKNGAGGGQPGDASTVRRQRQGVHDLHGRRSPARSDTLRTYATDADYEADLVRKSRPPGRL